MTNEKTGQETPRINTEKQENEKLPRIMTGYNQHAGCLLLLFLFEFFDHVFKLLEIFVCFDFFVGFAYCVYDLADVGGEAAPVLFDIVFRWMGVYGFLLSHFGKGSEFKDEVEPDVLHVKGVFVGDVCESFLYDRERGMVSGTPPRF